MDETLSKTPNSNNINNIINKYNSKQVEENNNNFKESALIRLSSDFNISSNESSELTSSSSSSISENVNLNSTFINKNSKDNNDNDIRNDIIMSTNTNDEKNNAKLIKDVASSLSSSTSKE